MFFPVFPVSETLAGECALWLLQKSVLPTLMQTHVFPALFWLPQIIAKV
jgi:hypothetical protein